MTLNRITVAIVALVLSLPATAVAAELKSHKQKFSYSVGYRLAISLMNEGLDADPDAFAAAMKDALSGGKPALSTEEMQAALNAERDIQLKALEEKIAENKKAGDKYRADYAKKEGVKSLENGISYKVIKSGDGKQASADSQVSIPTLPASSTASGRTCSGKCAATAATTSSPASPSWNSNTASLPPLSR